MASIKTGLTSGQPGLGGYVGGQSEPGAVWHMNRHLTLNAHWAHLILSEGAAMQSRRNHADFETVFLNVKF